MNKNFYKIAILVIFTSNSFAQKWTYKSSKNEFDGSYKSALINGKSDFPFGSPIFVVNLFKNELMPNIYIKDAGYAGCDNLIAIIKFDKDENLYYYSCSSNENRDTWFLDIDYEAKTNQLNLLDFFDALKSNSKLSVRLSSDCNKKDIYFSLNGSKEALDFTIKEVYQYGIKIKANKEYEESLLRNEQLKFEEENRRIQLEKQNIEQQKELSAKLKVEEMKNDSVIFGIIKSVTPLYDKPDYLSCNNIILNTNWTVSILKDFKNDNFYRVIDCNYLPLDITRKYFILKFDIVFIDSQKIK